jgi:hypothetical protein
MSWKATPVGKNARPHEALTQVLSVCVGRAENEAKQFSLKFSFVRRMKYLILTRKSDRVMFRHLKR